MSLAPTPSGLDRVRFPFAAFLAIALAVSTASGAKAEASAPRLSLQGDVVGRANPAGVMAFAGARYRMALGSSTVPDWPASYFQTGLGLGVNPAYAQASLHVEWMPWAFAVLRAQGDLFEFLGSNGALLELPDRDAAFDDHAISAGAGAERKRIGGRLLFQPTLRAKVGPVIVRNQTDLAFYRFGHGGPYFYEWEYDTLLRDSDGLVANRTALLFQLEAHSAEAMLLVGPSYEVVHAMAADLSRQRLGVSAYFCPTDAWGVLARPRFYAQTGVNLQDRNRAGQWFVAGGVGADLDIIR